MSAQFTDLKDKTIFITGASRGIGKAMAQALASHGSHVAFNYRGDESKANKLKENLMQLGASKVSALAFDITETQKMKEAVSEFIKQEQVHGLVNNAGICKNQLALRLKESDVLQTLNVNLAGAMLLSSLLTRGLMKADESSIVNVSSVVGLMGNSGQSAYAASKAGLIGFTKSYAKEMASKNIRCNAICPGFIATDMTDELPEKTKEQYFDQIPLSRFGTSAEVATLTCFLLSKASSYMTGNIIKIDGGLYI